MVEDREVAMSDVKPLLYRSEWGDYYAPVEHYTLEQAKEEIQDETDWTDEEVSDAYGGILAIPLHNHSMDSYEVYECPNYDDEVGDEPDPCIGYVDCHVFE